MLGHVLELKRLRDGGGSDEAAVEPALEAEREALRGTIRELVGVTLDEKQTRINRLREELAEEERRLAEERERAEQTVEEKYRQALSDRPPR